MARYTAGDLVKLLRESGTLVSGEQLSRQLGISRTAVWKHISALRSLGYQIDAVPSQGYCLRVEPEQLCEDSLCSLLGEVRSIGRKIVCLAETGSTNAEAFRLAESGAVEGTVVLADRQTAGKGRMGRRWESPAGVNLYCSVILRPSLPPYEAPQLTFLSAVAVARTIQRVSGVEPTIKWPNDILIHGCKVAGLLNEMNAETDQIGFVILGIGINLNMRQEQFPEDLRSPATSLMLASGSPVSRLAFTVQLLKELEGEYQRFLLYGFEPVRREWEQFCNAYGRQVRVEVGANVVEGAFGGIDSDGAMLVQLEGGRRERVLSGDVKVL